MNSAAILIGLNTYPEAANLASLAGPVNDCQDVAALLIKHNLIDPEYLYAYLYDTTQATVKIPGAKPLIDPGDVPGNGIVPRDTVVRTLTKVINTLGDRGVERLFVYLSGHGGDITQAVPPVSVLINSDFESTDSFSNLGLMVTDHLQNIVHNAPRIREAIIISDSCRKQLPALTVVPQVGPAPQFKAGTRCLTIKSSVHSTPSIEADVTGTGRIVGTFTHILLEELDLALSGDGVVYWRNICDQVAKRQELNGGGQRLDCQQVTAYPLLEVRAARLTAAPQSVLSVALRTAKDRLASVSTPYLRQVVSTMIAKYAAVIRRWAGTLWSMSGNRDGSRADLEIRAEELRDYRWNKRKPRDVEETLAEIRDLRRRYQERDKSQQRAAEPTRPPEVNPQAIYRYRSLINGIAAIQEVFEYLSTDEQTQLQMAKLILASEGDRHALERLQGKVTAMQWRQVESFLHDQITSADPLSMVKAHDHADGFTLKALEVIKTGDPNLVRVRLQIDGKDASVRSPAVRVYQHPTLVPVMLDVAFTQRTANFQLEIWGCFTIIAQVYGGPTLKLDLSTVDGIPKTILAR